MPIDPGIAQFAITERQREYILAAVKHGSFRGAAKALGVDESTVRNSVKGAKRRAEIRGYAPEHDLVHPSAPGFVVKGTSTLYDETGNVSQQWVKTSLSDEARLLAAQEAVEALKETLPCVKPVKAPQRTHSDLLNLYVVTDYHLGMRAWPEETRGAAWDTDIAEDLLSRWIDAGIVQSPNAEHGVLALMGDFLHWDGLDAVTPTNRYVLDADTRFQRVVRVAIRVIRRIVARLLTKHARLTLIIAEGNHDPASSIWMRELFHAHYDSEPRIAVDASADPFYCVEFGAVALFFHHGHKRAFGSVDAVLSAKFREVFGRTKHAFAHTGHYHSLKVSETPLMVVEQHRTLASPDAYSSRHGYSSGRDASVITYHATHGCVGRVIISPEMVVA